MAEPGLTGSAFCRAYVAAADGWLRSLLDGEGDVALVAVGGYGRGELCPHSDLDLLLLHKGRKDIGAVAERLWYPIWDAGIPLDHSVRTVKEAVAVADSDLKAGLGLLDARLVAGDAGLVADLLDKARALWRKRADRNLRALAAQVAERRGRFGEVAFLLEPDLKEGYGGLRDVHALRAAALASTVAHPPTGAVLDAAETLLTARVELHRRLGRPSDRLVLEEQDGVAAALGLDADELMARVASAARAVAWVSDDTWRRVASALAGKRGKPGRTRALSHDLVLRDDEVTLAPTAPVATDPALGLRAAVAAAEEGAFLSRESLARLAAEQPAPGDPWPPAMRHELVALLGTGGAAVPVLEALDAAGLLVRLLPEWEAVRSKPQRNAYHRFTVDRHLCEAAARAASLIRRVSRPDLLLVGAWLHDIGKGFPGDHTDAGMEVVAKIGARMGFPPADVDVLVDLVRHHLLLPDVATRRDLSDPRTAELVAAAVGDRQRLELLAALTEADSLATGPAAWSDWKATLVAQLVERAGALLAGAQAEPVNGLSDADRALAAEGRLAIRVEGSSVTVVAPDRPGSLCRVAGVFAIHGLDVLAAQASSVGPIAVDRFEVGVGATPPDWERIEADIGRALAGRLALAPRLDERARAYAPRRRNQAAAPAEARVLFDNDGSESATVVEVRAPDGVGVLYRITRALAECDLDVRAARVSTLGHEVVDTFYVTDAAGGKLDDEEHQREIERAILSELHR